MKLRRTLPFLATLLLACAAPAIEVRVSPKAGPLERFAAREVARYLYLRTGTLPPIKAGLDAKGRDVVLLARKDRFPAPMAKAVAGLKPQQFLLRTLPNRRLVAAGGDDAGTLYAAYRLADRLGVRFYLHGDVIPEGRIPNRLPNLNEFGKPLFQTRGVNPFHDFPEGPDWWNRDDYLSVVGQLAKLRMNFVGFHAYPEGSAGPEPLVRLGPEGDKAAYPALWANTARDGAWGYAAMHTSEYCGGASQLFPADVYGPEVMAGLMPQPSQADAAKLFDRTEAMLADAFSFAHFLGVQTCIGTETPLTIPAAVRARLDPKDPDPAQTVYRGTFARIAKRTPVDWYWLWTPESWTWGGNNPDEYAATLRDIRAAQAALKSLGNPFRLATCGWVLGPAQDRAALDRDLPKSVALSCINRDVGHDPVEPAFSQVQGRPKWAIPWLENDPELTSPQPWVGRMFADAADAARYGCTGLLGIHWRTKAIAPNVAALAQAAWASPPSPAPPAPAGLVGGKTARFDAPVVGADVQQVYETVRYDLRGYALPLANGRYDVILKFVEPYYSEPNKRVFGVKLNGRQALAHLDVFARVGKSHALDLTFDSISVTDGKLRIDFVPEVEYPCVAGIVVRGEKLVRRIDCGGLRLPGWEPDPAGDEPTPRDRALPVGAFYRDYARANFGEAVAGEVGAVLASVDGEPFPKPAFWGTGPGDVKVERLSPSQLASRYGFVRRLEALRAKVVGKGNLDRYDDMLRRFQAMEAMARAGSLRVELDSAMKDRAPVAEALRTRVALARAWERLIRLSVAGVGSPGDLGTIDNLERHTRRTSHFVDAHDAELAHRLCRNLPPEAALSATYVGPARLALPTVRTSARSGERLRLTVLLLPSHPGEPVSGRLLWRPLGRGAYHAIPLKHLSRAVYQAVLPPVPSGAIGLEYRIEATLGSAKLRFPADPSASQTVVLAGGQR